MSKKFGLMLSGVVAGVLIPLSLLFASNQFREIVLVVGETATIGDAKVSCHATSSVPSNSNAYQKCLDIMAELNVPDWDRRFNICKNAQIGGADDCMRAAEETGMPDWDRRAKMCEHVKSTGAADCLRTMAQLGVPGWDNRVERCKSQQ